MVQKGDTSEHPFPEDAEEQEHENFGGHQDEVEQEDD